MFIEEKLWSSYAFNFRRQLVKSPATVFQGAQLNQFLTLVENILDENKDDQHHQHHQQEEVETLSMEQSQDMLRSLLLRAMLQRAETELRSEIASSRTLLSCSDLRLPHEWYAPARLMKRKIIFHGGPTNSGVCYCYCYCYLSF
jgi:hypothetical protein